MIDSSWCLRTCMTEADADNRMQKESTHDR